MQLDSVTCTQIFTQLISLQAPYRTPSQTFLHISTPLIILRDAKPLLRHYFLPSPIILLQ